MRKKWIPSLLLSSCILLSGCNGQSQATAVELNASTTASTVNLSDLFSDRDMEIDYDEETAVQITLSDNGSTSDSTAVTVQENTVTITDEGTYILSGTLSDGMIVVNAEDTDKIQLVLDGVDITSATSAAIYIPNADKVFITTAADSVNTLKNGGEYIAIDDNNIDGVIFSKADLTLNGAGSLQIDSTVERGVVTKDDLVVTSGTYAITVAGHGLSGKDSVAISDGAFTLNTGKDGIQSDNDEDSTKGYVYLAGGTYTITAEGDGVSASSWMQVDGGDYTITTGGGNENGETHTDSMQPGGMGGGQRAPGMGMGGQRPQMTEGEDAPADMQLPEGMTPPDDGERPQFADRQQTEAPPEQPDDTQAPSAPVEDANTETTSEDTSTSTKGLKAGTTLTVNSGTFVLDCADDAFHSNGDLHYLNGTAQISTGDDALHADFSLVVENGTINILTCYEGLEGQSVTVNDGVIDLIASDDGINAAGDGTLGSQDIFITIAGGTITINAGGDGVDSNGNLNVSGGTTYISCSGNGADSPIDYDGEANITGGVVIGAGAAGMAQNFGSNSTQGSILLTVDNQAAGNAVSISDSNGNVITSWEIPNNYSSVVISAPELTVGNTYTVTTGSVQTDVTLDTLIYGSGSMQPGSGKGGRGQLTTQQ